MFKNQIIKLMEVNALVSVFINIQDTQLFDCGKFVTYNDDFYVMEYISKNGINDGLFLGKSNKIIRIEYDSKYQRRISLLINNYSSILKPNEIDSTNPLSSLLAYISKNERITEIELVDSGYFDVTGFIISLDKEKCIVKEIDDDGEIHGTTMIRLSDITQVSCCSENEVLIEKLYKIKNRSKLME